MNTPAGLGDGVDRTQTPRIPKSKQVKDTAFGLVPDQEFSRSLSILSSAPGDFEFDALRC